MPSANRRTYFKRELPAPAVAFSCAEGRAIFAEALAAGTMVGFFRLIEQFTTQEEPQYCGLAALVVTLNALGIDPRRTWKGAWRWWAETMLDCCKSMDDIKRDGITMGQVACLARCNGADVSVHRAGAFDPAAFRSLLAEVCGSEDRVIVASYSRKTFNQSGDGHFSPLGGYCARRDMVLILDVARFKYSPHWVRVDDLLEAMAQPDPAIGKPRGFLLLGCRTPRESALFALDPAVAPLPRQLPPAALRSSLVGGSSSSGGMGMGMLLPAGGSGELGAALGACSGGWGSGPGLDKVGSCSSLSSLGGCSNGTGGASPAPPGGADAAAVAAAAAVAEAYAFITRQAPALLRQQLGLAAGPAVAGQAGGDATAAADDEDHELEPEEGPGQDEEQEQGSGAATAGSAAISGGGGGGGVPTLEGLVAALVAAAPLQSICTLLVRRPTLAAVGEPVPGPCCGCPVAAAAAAVAAAAVAAAAGAAGVQEAAGAVMDASGGATSGGGGGGACCSGGGAASGTNGTVTAVAPSPFLPLASARPATDAHAHAHTHTHSGGHKPGSSSCCKAGGSSSSSSSNGDHAASGPGSTASEGLVSADGNGSSNIGSGSSSRAGDEGAKPGAPLGLYGRNSAGATFVGGSSSSDGSSSHAATGDGSSSSRCCHGEPLEHHCVPPQVQALTLEELRFTNMFKLVSYSLRRAAGCSHAPPPDLSAFMKPAMPAPAVAAPLPAAAGAAPAAVPAPAVAPAPAGQQAAAAATANGGSSSSGGADGECGCSLGLPEMAAEKLTAALLLLSEADCWPVQQLQPQPQPGADGNGSSSSASGGNDADGGMAAAAATAAAAAAGVRVCRRPNCRRCRRRLAAAGDRAAALALLREGWGSLLRLAPLGLYASSPVLRDELAFVRLQLASSPVLAGCLAPTAPPPAAAAAAAGGVAATAGAALAAT